MYGRILSPVNEDGVHRARRTSMSGAASAAPSPMMPSATTCTTTTAMMMMMTSPEAASSTDVSPTAAVHASRAAAIGQRMPSHAIESGNGIGDDNGNSSDVWMTTPSSPLQPAMPEDDEDTQGDCDLQSGSMPPLSSTLTDDQTRHADSMHSTNHPPTTTTMTVMMMDGTDSLPGSAEAERYRLMDHRDHLLDSDAMEVSPVHVRSIAKETDMRKKSATFAFAGDARSAFPSDTTILHTAASLSSKTDHIETATPLRGAEDACRRNLFDAFTSKQRSPTAKLSLSEDLELPMKRPSPSKTLGWQSKKPSDIFARPSASRQHASQTLDIATQQLDGSARSAGPSSAFLRGGGGHTSFAGSSGSHWSRRSGGQSSRAAAAGADMGSNPMLHDFRAKHRARRTYSEGSMAFASLQQRPGILPTGIKVPCPAPYPVKVDCFQGKCDAIPRITPQTLVRLLENEHQDDFDGIHIIDSRFKYEFDGGHIRRAESIIYPEDLMAKFFTDEALHACARKAIIFHCEFSSHRGPRLALHMREKDRALNTYPDLYYPHIYILEGGYKQFFAEAKPYCEPQAYIEMKDTMHRDELRRFMSSTRMVWRRYKSFSDDFIHADLNNYIDDDSPWDNPQQNETSTDTMITQNQINAGIFDLAPAKRRKSDADVFSSVPIPYRGKPEADPPPPLPHSTTTTATTTTTLPMPTTSVLARRSSLMGQKRAIHLSGVFPTALQNTNTLVDSSVFSSGTTELDKAHRSAISGAGPSAAVASPSSSEVERGDVKLTENSDWLANRNEATATQGKHLWGRSEREPWRNSGISKTSTARGNVPFESARYGQTEAEAGQKDPCDDDDDDDEDYDDDENENEEKKKGGRNVNKEKVDDSARPGQLPADGEATAASPQRGGMLASAIDLF